MTHHNLRMGNAPVSACWIHTQRRLRFFTSPVTSHLFPTSAAKSSCLTPYGIEVANGPLDKKDKRVIYRNTVLSLHLTPIPLNELSHTLHLLTTFLCLETTTAKNVRKKALYYNKNKTMHPRFISTSKVSLAVDCDFQHTQLVLLNIADSLWVCMCVGVLVSVCHDDGYQW